jgi:hypothetical protein
MSLMLIELNYLNQCGRTIINVQMMTMQIGMRNIVTEQTSNGDDHNEYTTHLHFAKAIVSLQFMHLFIFKQIIVEIQSHF